jgi:hypothetical protein
MNLAYLSRSWLTVLVLVLAAGACSSSSKTNNIDAQAGDGSIDAGGPMLRASSATLNFSVLCPGQSSAPQTLQIMNDGGSPVPVYVKLTGTDAADFTATTTGCDLLASGTACTVAVVLNKTKAGPESAMLEVSGPDSSYVNKVNIAISNAALGGMAPVVLTGPSDLGSVAVGTTGPAVALTLTVYGQTGTCAGPDPALPFTVTLSSTEFVITNDTCSTAAIPVGGTCTINVALKPTSAGAKSASLVVALPSFSRTVDLTGMGVSAIDAGPGDSVDSSTAQSEAGAGVVDGTSAVDGTGAVDGSSG